MQWSACMSSHIHEDGKDQFYFSSRIFYFTPELNNFKNNGLESLMWIRDVRADVTPLNNLLHTLLNKTKQNKTGEKTSIGLCPLFPLEKQKRSLLSLSTHRMIHITSHLHKPKPNRKTFYGGFGNYIFTELNCTRLKVF